MMVKLSDVFDLQMGKTPSRNNNTYWNDGEYDWISISDLGNYEKYVSSTKEKITELAIKESGIKKVPSNTLIMSFKLSVGKTAITKDEVYTNEAIMAFIPNNKYDVYTDYFYHLFSGKDWSKDTNRAVMGATLNKSTLGQIMIKIPPLEEQRKVAETLDKVSNLIAKRKQQLEKLDLLVKSKFVEMFGDETENRWNCVLAEDVAQICVGVVIKPSQYYTDINGIPAFRSLNIGYMTVKNTDWVYFTKEGYNKNTKSIIKENDVLVIRSGAPGTACVATKEFDGYNAIDIIIAHPNLKKVNSFYLAMFTNMPHGMNQIKGKIGGAAQQHFNVGAYKELLLMLPPIELQNQFADFVKQTEKTKTIINQSLEKLETLKKALMQEYFG